METWPKKIIVPHDETVTLTSTGFIRAPVEINSGDHNNPIDLENARLTWAIGKMLQDPAKRERIIAFVEELEAR